MTIFVRPARPEDAEQFTNWYSKSDSFDPVAALSPNAYTLCAFTENKVLGYLPISAPAFTTTQFLEALAMNPEATDLEIAGAMREFVKHAITIGYMKNCNLIYFVGDHPETNKIAERIFTKVEYPVYELRLTDLEGR